MKKREDWGHWFRFTFKDGKTKVYFFGSPIGMYERYDKEKPIKKEQFQTEQEARTVL